MPELPEVETIKRDLVQRIIGARIQDLRIFDARVIRNISSADFREYLRDQMFVEIHRRGKALIFWLQPGPYQLVIQLMMTGQLVYSTTLRQEKATKLLFSLSKGGYLLYNDQRLFGRLQLVATPEEIKYFRILGPEPLGPDFYGERFAAQLKRSARPIKNVLLDHTVVAGIGNIYASEILFAAGVRPQRRASGLKKIEAQRLFCAIPAILSRAVRSRGTSMNTYRDGSGRRGNFMKQIQVYGRDGENCRHCGRKILRMVLAGRSTFYCSHCQR